MVQPTKAYKVSWKQTLKAYKSNMGTKKKKKQTNEHMEIKTDITPDQ